MCGDSVAFNGITSCSGHRFCERCCSAVQRNVHHIAGDFGLGLPLRCRDFKKTCD
uniref:Uncharacterized protein n=1 Tax=Anguilla anguilla TaxID=7936 RepID=A0A0E9XXI9_ANGAN